MIRHLVRKILIIIFISQLSCLDASYCGSGSIPFRLEILPTGKPVLGCAIPSCFGTNSDLKSPPKFVTYEQENVKDGFVRKQDLNKADKEYNGEQAKCKRHLFTTSCHGSKEWVAGIRPMDTTNSTLIVQCCTYELLKTATTQLREIKLKSGEMFIGGEAKVNNKQTGFDIIKNVQRKTNSTTNQLEYTVTVVRMRCPPRTAPQEENKVVDEATSGRTTTKGKATRSTPRPISDSDQREENHINALDADL